MTFTTNRSELAATLAWVARALPARPTNNVLHGMHLKAVDGTLTVSAFDYEQSASATVDVDSADFDIVLHGKTLTDYVRALPGETVTVEVKETSVAVSSGRSKLQLPKIDVNLYPTLPAVPDLFGTIGSRIFADAVRQVAGAATTDAALPALTGICVSINPDEETVEFAATDRYRLAVTRLPFTPGEGTAVSRLLIPAKILEAYAKAFPDASVIDLHAGGAPNALFGVTAAGQTATTRLLDAEFPNYSRLIPTDFVSEVRMNAAQVSAAMKRVAMIGERQQAMRVVFANNEMTISMGDATLSHAQAATETVDVTYDGDEFTTAFNPAHLLDGMSHAGTDEVVLKLVAPAKAALLCPSDEADPFQYLVMPVRQ